VTHVLQPLLIFCTVPTIFHIYSELQEHKLCNNLQSAIYRYSNTSLIQNWLIRNTTVIVKGK